MIFKLPELNYSYDALEPHIDKQTMEIHHTKHHQAYVDKLNQALEKYPEFQNMEIEEILKSLDKLPEDIKAAVRNNGGGHYNHDLFWRIMSPDGERQPVGELAKKIDEKFGDFESFKAKFKDASVGRFGSGWGWLVLNSDNSIDIVSTPNQDNPISEGKKVIFGLDVWEHAYYLKYMNKRPDYIDAWWNVVNWSIIEDRYQSLK